MTLTDIAILALKSGVVAGLGLILARLVGRRPVERAAMLRSAVVLTAALPLLTVLLPVVSLAVLPAEPQAIMPMPVWSGRIEPVDGYALSGVIREPGPEFWIAMAWLAVSVALAVRLAIGLTTLMRWSREGRAPRGKAWTAALDALASSRRPQLLVSERARGPLSWGLPPGAILIDRASEARPETATAVIAHELAHLRRGDWVFLMLSRLMLVMFWFNPLCWRLHSELVARSEEAADAEAVKTVDRSAYARTLVSMAIEPGATPMLATGMAADPHELKQRIKTLMTPNSPRRPLTLALSLVALAAVATPLAALEISRQDPPMAPLPPVPPVAPLAPPAPEAPTWTAQGAEVPAPPPPPAPPAPPAAPRGSGVFVFSRDDRSPEAEQAREDARAAREEARAARDAIRAQADDLRRLALAQARDVSAQRADAERIRVEARAAAEAGRQAAAAGRLAATAARAESERAMAQARVEMSRGADQMRQGAEQMREEARRLADPAHRARVIEDNRARGHTVTDEELRELAPRLREQADQLERQADELARQSRAS